MNKNLEVFDEKNRMEKINSPRNKSKFTTAIIHYAPGELKPVNECINVEDKLTPVKIKSNFIVVDEPPLVFFAFALLDISLFPRNLNLTYLLFSSTPVYLAIFTIGWGIE